MKSTDTVFKLQEYAQKPMAGFEVLESKGNLLIRTKAKNGLFGCLGIFIFVSACLLFFFLSDETLKIFIPIFIILAGASMLYKLSANAAQILVKFKQSEIIYSNSNFIGKLGRKAITISVNDLKGFSVKEELRSGLQSSSGTSSNNKVLRVYLIATDFQLPLITVNKGLFTTNEMEDVAGLIEQIVKHNNL